MSQVSRASSLAQSRWARVITAACRDLRAIPLLKRQHWRLVRCSGNSRFTSFAEMHETPAHCTNGGIAARIASVSL